MTLVKNDKKETFTGPGLIRQTGQKYFEFILFYPHDNIESQGSIIQKNIEHAFGLNKKLLSGQIIPDDEKYTLTTTEGWKASNLYHVDEEHKVRMIIFTGCIYELTKETDKTDIHRNLIEKNPSKTHSKYLFLKPTIDYLFFDELKYPANRRKIKNEHIEGEPSLPGWSLDALKFRSNNYNIRITKEKDYIKYQISTQRTTQQYNNIIEHRAIETLEFLLGRPLHWNIKQITYENMERVHIRVIPKTINYNKYAAPPLQWMAPLSLFSNDFKSMYTGFLNFILKDTENERHPLSKRLTDIYIGSHGSFETYVLTLATEIEGIISDYYNKETSPDQKFIKEVKIIMELLRNYSKDHKISKTTCDRCCGHLGHLNQKKSL